MNSRQFTVEKETRLDLYLSEKLEESRNQIEQLIKKGFVTVQNKQKAKSGLKLQVGQEVIVNLPEVVKEEAFGGNFFQECAWAKEVAVVFEDEYFMVLNKPSGVIVHTAPSVHEATLVDWLKEKNISLSTISGEERHGIVHRLDKGTSGLMVIAKTNEAHEKLSKQLETKTMGRYYLAMIDLPLKEDVTIDKPIGRNPHNRLKMGVVPEGKNAKTSFAKIALSEDKRYELIAAKLYTGRTHQIRVHLESLQRHILGDSLYGFKGNLDKLKRVYLHAYSLYLQHPISGVDMSFYVDFPADMQNFYNKYFNKENNNEKICQEFIIHKFDTTH